MGSSDPAETTPTTNEAVTKILSYAQKLATKYRLLILIRRYTPFLTLNRLKYLIVDKCQDEYLDLRYVVFLLGTENHSAVRLQANIVKTTHSLFEARELRLTG